MRNALARVWGRRFYAAATLAIISTSLVFVVGALADAGNPILGTIRASAVDNNDGTVTIYVRGQWNWLSHNSDCNFDRAATGVGIVWNDTTEPGFTVAKGSISEKVGIASLRTGDTVNMVDQMVHPVDRGNVPEGYTVGTWKSTAQGYATNAAGDFPDSQAFSDPATPSITNQTAFGWKGGCGREPLTATASKGSNPESSGKSCADGTTTCGTHPWGSWGYEKNGGLGYAHTYLKTALPDKVCANFYDVHGGGKFNSGKFQLVNGGSATATGNNKEITVNANGDNSIQTNAFNTSDGRNCISLIKPTLTTEASSATVGDPIHDTATLSGVPAGAGGTITFKAYGPRSLTSTTPACTTLAFTSNAIPVSGPGPYGSGDFTPTAAGKYDWTASYTGDSGTLVLGVSTACGDANETSTVAKKSPTLTTAAGGPFAVGTNGKAALTDSATLTGATSGAGGTVTFTLYGPDPTPNSDPTDDCTLAVKVGTATASVSGGAAGPSAPALSVGPGRYHWTAHYGGDTNNNEADSACGDTGENPLVIDPSIKVTKNPKLQSLPSGGTASWTIKVENDGDSTLTNVAVTDAQAPNCARTSAQIAADSNAPQIGTATFNVGDTYSYNCTLANVTSFPLVNVVVACGTSIVSTTVCDNDNATAGDRTGQADPSTLTTKQDFVPNDTATLAGLVNAPVGGSVTFSLYKDVAGTCTPAKRIYTETINVSTAGNGSYPTTNADRLSALNATAGLGTGTAGNYNWKVDYSGDAASFNAAIPGTCGKENFQVDNG